MKEVESYRIAWNANADEGSIMLQTTDGVEQILLDSASEGTLLLDILRNEKPVYVENGVIFTGFEPVGEGEVSAEASSEA